jgi:hypothetical protein
MTRLRDCIPVRLLAFFVALCRAWRDVREEHEVAARLDAAWRER